MTSVKWRIRQEEWERRLQTMRWNVSLHTVEMQIFILDWKAPDTLLPWQTRAAAAVKQQRPPLAPKGPTLADLSHTASRTHSPDLCLRPSRSLQPHCVWLAGESRAALTWWEEGCMLLQLHVCKSLLVLENTSIKDCGGTIGFFKRRPLW